ALAGLQVLYHAIANFLKLRGQMGIIDYQAKNFVHADLTHAEFEQMQAQRGESLAGFALQAGRHAKKPGKQPNAAKLLLGVIAGKPNLVKLELVHTLSQGDDQIAALTGETVIITDRNRRCVEVMERQLEEGRRKLGIFYG